MMNKKQVSDIITLIVNAGKEIIRIYYNEDFRTIMKEDNSPVTIADLASDKIIKEGLNVITPGISVFSEETKEISYSIRAEWNPLWILDPLDGTKEFIDLNGEFCISLALVSENSPVAAFIHAPVSSETWFALKGNGAFKIVKGEALALPLNIISGPIKINISRSFHTKEEAVWIESFKRNNDAEIIVQGSAIKFCRIAEGVTDIYPKFGKINEWDVAAGHLILVEAGGKMIELATGKQPLYNKSDFHQAPFIATGRRIKNPERLIEL